MTASTKKSPSMTATLALNKPDRRTLRMLRGAERSIELSRANALSSGATRDIETKPRSADCSLRRVRRVMPARWRCAPQISLILIFAVGIGSNEPLAQARDSSTQSVGAGNPEWLTFRDHQSPPQHWTQRHTVALDERAPRRRNVFCLLATRTSHECAEEGDVRPPPGRRTDTGNRPSRAGSSGRVTAAPPLRLPVSAASGARTSSSLSVVPAAAQKGRPVPNIVAPASAPY